MRPSAKMAGGMGAAGAGPPEWRAGLPFWQMVVAQMETAVVIMESRVVIGDETRHEKRCSWSGFGVVCAT